MTNAQDKLKNLKVVIAGLDNAGKTSCLIALKQKYNFHEEVKNLKPTVRIEYSSLNFLILLSYLLSTSAGKQHAGISLRAR